MSDLQVFYLLQHLRSVQLSRTRETRLREEVESLRQQRQELQYDVALLEEDNQVLREEIQQLRGEPGTPGSPHSLLVLGSGFHVIHLPLLLLLLLPDDTSESHSFMMQKEEEEPPLPPSPLVLSRDPQVEEQLRHMQEKLRLKDAEVADTVRSSNFALLLKEGRYALSNSVCVRVWCSVRSCSQSCSPVRPDCRSAGRSSGNSVIVSGDRSVCVCVCACVSVCVCICLFVCV